MNGKWAVMEVEIERLTESDGGARAGRKSTKKMKKRWRKRSRDGGVDKALNPLTPESLSIIIYNYW